MLAISGHRDLPVGPFAGKMDANTGHDGGAVLQAEGGQVQTGTRGDTDGGLTAVIHTHRTKLNDYAAADQSLIKESAPQLPVTTDDS